MNETQLFLSYLVKLEITEAIGVAMLMGMSLSDYDNLRLDDDNLLLSYTFYFERQSPEKRRRLLRIMKEATQ